MLSVIVLERYSVTNVKEATFFMTIERTCSYEQLLIHQPSYKRIDVVQTQSQLLHISYYKIAHNLTSGTKWSLKYLQFT